MYQNMKNVGFNCLQIEQRLQELGHVHYTLNKYKILFNSWNIYVSP